MTKKTKRTQVKDLAVSETELTLEEARKVKGGTSPPSPSEMKQKAVPLKKGDLQ